MGGLPRVPKPRPPHLDLPKLYDDANARIKKVHESGGRAELLREVQQPIVKSIEEVHQKAGQAPPSRPAQDFPEVFFFPTNWTEHADGPKKLQAEIGRSTLRKLLTSQVGQKRADEIARNIVDRNPHRSAFESIYPQIHPDGENAHFDGPAWVIREPGEAVRNASARPLLRLISYRKADGLPYLLQHEAAHLAGSYGGNGVRDQDPYWTPSHSKAFWSGLMSDQSGQYLGDNFLDLLRQSSEEYGLDFDLANGVAGPMDSFLAADVFKDLKNGYVLGHQETYANGLPWKNQALARAGYESFADLPKGMDERSFIRKALTEDLVPYAPRDATDRFDVDTYNRNHGIMRSINDTIKPEHRDVYHNFLYRLGAGAGVTAAGAAASQQPQRQQSY